MINTLKKAFLAVALVSTMALPLLVPAAVFADANTGIDNGLCAGADLNAGEATSCSSSADASAANTKITSILSTVINIFSLIVGAVSVIMIIIGGLRYITSGGEASNISSAKNTIIYAIVGLVVVALAQFLVHFVLGKVTATT
jgi:hypothetical protein